MFKNGNEERLRGDCYIIAPRTLNTIEECKKWDGYALRDMENIKEILAKLEEYRSMLAQRAMDIASSQYSYKLTLVREKHWYNNTVTYKINLWKVYPEANKIQSVSVFSEVYAGKERHTALKRFEQLLKEYPGIDYEKDISKAAWEVR